MNNNKQKTQEDNTQTNNKKDMRSIWTPERRAKQAEISKNIWATKRKKELKINKIKKETNKQDVNTNNTEKETDQSIPKFYSSIKKIYKEFRNTSEESTVIINSIIDLENRKYKILPHESYENRLNTSEFSCFYFNGDSAESLKKQTIVLELIKEALLDAEKTLNLYAEQNQIENIKQALCQAFINEFNKQ